MSNISPNDIIYNIKPRDIFDTPISKAVKRKSYVDPEGKEIKENDNHISIKMEPIPNFANLKSSIYRNINKNIPKDVEDLSDLP